MKDKIRIYGLDAVKDIPLGTHFCQFYQTKEELIELIGPYFRSGLETSEFCIWILPQLLDVKEAKESLKKIIPEFESYLKKGQIEIHSGTAWQEEKEKEKEDTKEGKKLFDFQKNLDFLAGKLNQVLERGYKGLRIAEDSSRAKKENWNNFVTYQNKLDSFVYKKPLITLSTSPLKDFDAFELLDFSSRAQFTLIKKAGKWEKIQNNDHNINDHNINDHNINDDNNDPNNSHKKEPAYKYQYQEIFNSISQGIQVCELIFDEEGQPVDNLILDVNPAYEKHSGLRREQVVGKHIKEILPVVEQSWLDSYAEVVVKRRELHFEEYNASLDMWFEVFASPLEGKKFLTIFSDITQRKRMEENQELLRALIDHNPSLVFMKDESGRYVYLNNTYEKQFVQSKDWHGKTDFDFWPKESAELFRANDTYVLESGQPQQNLEDSTDLNGTRYCWLNYKFPFTDSKNERFVGGIGIDVTDRIRAEEALSKAYEEIQRKSQELQASNEELQTQSEELQAQSEEIQTQTEELKDAYQELSESEKRYRLLFTNMNEGFLLGEPLYDEKGHSYDYRFLEVNPAFELNTGLKRNEILGRTIKEVLKNPSLLAIEKYGEVARSGESMYVEVFSQELNRYLDNYIFCPEKGKFAAIFMDVTERKRMENALRNKEEHLEDLLKSIQDGFFELDQEWKFTYINQRAAQNAGFKPEELIGECIWDKFSWTLGSKYETALRQVMKTRIPASFEIESIAAKRWHAINIYPSASGISIFWIEITERKQAEQTIFKAYERIQAQSEDLQAYNEEMQAQAEELQAQTVELMTANEALSESEERYRLLFANSIDAIIVTDPAAGGKILSANPAACKLLGWAEEELIGKGRDFLFDLSDEALSSLLEERKRVGLARSQLIYKRKNGTRFIGELSTALFTDISGEQRAVVILRDVTERYQMEGALKKSEERYRTLFTNMTEGFGLIECLYDEDEKPYDYRYLEINPTFERYLGVKREEMLGKTMLELFPNANPTALEEYKKAALSGEPANFEIFSKVANKYLEIYAFSPEKGKIALILRDISWRKQAEEALKKALETLRYSEDQFRTLVQNVKSGIALIDEAGKFAVVNPTFMRMFGLSDKLDILNVNNQDWSLWEVYEENGEPLHIDDHPVRKAAMSGKPVKDKLVAVKNPEAEELTWMLVNAEPMPKENGQVYRVICTYHDITERKQAEIALQESEKKYREFFNTSAVGAMEIDFAGRIISTNDCYCQITGYSRDELLGMNVLDLSHPDARYLDSEVLASYLNSENPIFDIEKRYVRKDGKVIWVHVSASKVFDAKSDPLRSRAMVQDITQKKEAEAKLKETLENQENLIKIRTDELQKAYNSLKESERGLSEAQKMAHIGNWSWDILTGKVYWSDEKYRIFGFSPQALEITYELFSAYVHPEDRQYVDNLNKRAFKGEPYNTEFRIIAADGIEHIVHEQCEIIFDGRKLPVMVRGTTQDITERKKTEKALIDLETARLKEIHHRIKNNLQVISSLLDLQAENLNSKPDLTHSEILEAFRESQDRVASIALIHEELYAGKGTDSLNFSLYLQKLIKSLFQTYRVGNPNISLKLDLPENIFFDMDNAIPLGIIVNELVSNSLKHAFPERNEGEIRIQISREEQQESIDSIEGDKVIQKSSQEDKIKANSGDGESSKINYTLSVSDNGVGIPENFDLADSETLGIQLVTILTDQLDGTLDLIRDSGTEFIIKFSLANLAAELTGKQNR